MNKNDPLLNQDAFIQLRAEVQRLKDEAAKPDCRLCQNYITSDSGNSCNQKKDWWDITKCVNGNLFKRDETFDQLWKTT